MNVQLMGKRKIWHSVTLVAVVLSIIFLFTFGLNLGIDFTGGNRWDLRFERDVTIEEVRAVLALHGLENAKIQQVKDSPNEILIQTPHIEDYQREQIFSDLQIGVGEFEALEFEQVSPTIGDELKRAGGLALLIATLAMIGYISIRFEWKFALSAIAALFHDIIILFGFFALFQIEVSSTIIPAMLTVFGYSINDTIVIFDRIRENKKTMKANESYVSLVDRSISQTLNRSINTTITTLLAVSALYFFGGKTIQEFALALMVGVLAGAYSSIFVASPIWVDWMERQRLRKKVIM